MITRTINSTAINYLLFNLNNMTVETDTRFVTGKELTVEQATDIMNKVNLSDNEKFLKVNKVSTTSVKYGMDEETFMVYGSSDYDRSVRMVTRTIKSTIITALYFDLDTMQTVTDDILITGKELTVEQATDIMNKGSYNGSRKFLKVTGISVSTINYGMPETEFIRRAKVIE